MFLTKSFRTASIRTALLAMPVLLAGLAMSSARCAASPVATAEMPVAAATKASMQIGVAHAPDIDGHWISVVPESQGPLFVTRDFTATDGRWSMLYRAFADRAAHRPLFALRVKGVYLLGGPSPTVPQAWEGIFPALGRDIIAESPDGIAMFAHMGCALKLNEAKALISEKCGFVPSLMTAMGEYDLVSLKHGSLFFGDRSGDLTKTRPTALYPYPLLRR